MIRILSQATRFLLPLFAVVLAVMIAPGATTVRADDAAPPAAATAPATAPASTTAPASVQALSPADRAQADQLVKTLEDPAARDKLIAQLKLLSQINKPVAPPSAGTGLVRDLSQALQDAGDTLVTAAAEIANVGSLIDFLSAQADDQRAQDRVLRVVIRLVTVFVAGLIIEWILVRLLRRPSRYVDTRPATNRWVRLPLAMVRWVFDLVPVAGFAASAYAMLVLPFYRPGGHSELVSVAVITAYAASAGINTLIKAVLEPQHPAWRVIPLSDADATRLAVWMRRLARVGVWGYYGDDVLRLLGLPPVGFESLLKLLGLAMAIIAVMIVIEFRRPVSGWIRGSSVQSAADRQQRAELERRVAGLRKGLADIWHVLAMLYVVAAFIIWALRVEGGFEFLLRATLLTAAILVAARLASSTLTRLVDRFFATTADLPPLVATRRRRYRRLLRNAIQAVLAILALLGILAAWGADTLEWLGSDMGQRLVSSAATIAVVIVVAVIVWEGVSGGIERYLARTDTSGQLVTRSARARTLLPLLRNAFTILLVLIVVLIVLSQLGVQVAPLIAGAGVVGVAIGFGSQKLVQDVITGAFILFEDTLAVGDTVTIGDHSGVVEGMTIRTMRLRSGTGDLHTLPFSSVTAVINQSRGFANFPFSIGVSYRDDADKAMDVMRAVGEELRKDPVWGAELGAPVEVFGIDKFADLAVVVSGQIRTMPGRQVSVGREYYRRLKKRFDELGIVIPHTVGPYEMAKAAATAAVADGKPATPSQPPAPPAEVDRREP